MEHYSLFAYLRLKILVTLFRVMLTFLRKSARSRDALQYANMNVKRQRIKIPSRDSNRYIEADVYSPPSNSNAKTPVLINWHGSGFIFPLLGSDALYCSQIVRDTGITIIDADYRKGPETTFPGPLNDAIDVLKWVSAQDQFDSKKIGLSGFSAGGTIALAAASSSIQDRSEIEIPIVIAMYPVTDLSIAPEAKTVPRPKNAHSPFMQHMFNDCYAPDIALRKDPRVSPSKADPALFPDTVVIVTCDGDIFEPEASALTMKLDDGKRRVIHQALKDVHHGFDKGCVEGTSDWDKRKETYALLIKTLQKTIGQDIAR
jgi:acetyl esterase/lipase